MEYAKRKLRKRNWHRKLRMCKRHFAVNDYDAYGATKKTLRHDACPRLYDPDGVSASDRKRPRPPHTAVVSGATLKHRGVTRRKLGDEKKRKAEADAAADAAQAAMDRDAAAAAQRSKADFDAVSASVRSQMPRETRWRSAGEGDISTAAVVDAAASIVAQVKRDNEAFVTSLLDRIAELERELSSFRDGDDGAIPAVAAAAPSTTAFNPFSYEAAMRCTDKTCRALTGFDKTELNNFLGDYLPVMGALYRNDTTHKDRVVEALARLRLDIPMPIMSHQMGSSPHSSTLSHRTAETLTYIEAFLRTNLETLLMLKTWFGLARPSP